MRPTPSIAAEWCVRDSTLPGRGRRGPAAFTLVEMLLAIGIAVGMLIVALLFYRQVADLRAQILAESERLATVRLLMDRIAGDLRTAWPMPGLGHEFRGETGSLSFVRVGSVAAAAGPDGPAGERMRITVTTVLSDEGTNRAVRGVDRLEESVGTARPMTGRPPGLLEASAPATLDSMTLSTNRVTDPLTELVRFLHFRYWNGALWLDEWTNAASPQGVEVILGFDPLPEGSSPTEYPFEQFRRVVFLPTAVPPRKLSDAPVELPFTP